MLGFTVLHFTQYRGLRIWKSAKAFRVKFYCIPAFTAAICSPLTKVISVFAKARYKSVFRFNCLRRKTIFDLLQNKTNFKGNWRF
jgi:hypothetical protein